MVENHWIIVGEVEAGGVWAAVAEHPSVDRLDRLHCDSRTSLGLWLSSYRNPSQGCFLTNDWHAGHVQLGSVVAVPAGVPFHVQAEAAPARRMLHCRLPERVSLEAGPVSLDACFDMHNGVIANSLSRLAQEVMAPGFGTKAIVEGLGLVISGELERAFADRTPRKAKGGLAPWQLRRMDDYLRAGHWNSSVSDLAHLCGISPGHAMRAFRQSTGRSIAAHIAALRVDRACELLAQDELSVAQIAADLRFARPSGFAAAFRRSMGMSPHLYRQFKRVE